MKRLALLLVVATSILASNSIDTAFQKFWNARNPNEAAKAIGDIAKSGVTFEEALRRLKAGRSYDAQKAGVILASNRTEDGVEHHYAIGIPDSYDPSRKYQVRFQLHGGVGGRDTNQPRGTGAIGALAGDEQIYVLPYAWNRAPWWSDDQVLNLNAIVDSLKRTYNVDENRVVVSGVSDGATGAYFIAMRDTTPFASFLPLNGSTMVLTSNGIDDGKIFPNNFLNKPMFVVNGGLDPLYPAGKIEPWIDHLAAGGVDISYNPQPQGAHNTSWWPVVKGPFEEFARDHPREPHPDRLTWETADLVHNRAHWLVIDKIGAQPGDTKTFVDLNVWGSTNPAMKFSGAANAIFVRETPAGRADAVRKGNTIEVKSKGVAAFTLLISPDRFDLSRPIAVTANGRTVFEGRVQPSLETLLKWAARDNDRTMLYAAEIKIKL